MMGRNKKALKFSHIDHGRSIVPIVRAKDGNPISEVLGTGFVIGGNGKLHLLTAKHVIEANPLAEGEKYAFVTKVGSVISVYQIPKVLASLDYDVACCEILQGLGCRPLAFAHAQPSLNEDVFCHEYSGTRITKNMGHTHVSFEPMSHKGNVMRYYDSDFPETTLTPSMLTSFPALQGASGAPLIAIKKGKHGKGFYVAGMMVANQEKHLLPAQVVKIQDGERYSEETSYFLPLGKAINASVIKQFLKEIEVEMTFVY